MEKNHYKVINIFISFNIYIVNIFISLSICFITKNNDSIEILQTEKPNIDVIQDTISNNQLTVFQNVLIIGVL